MPRRPLPSRRSPSALLLVAALLAAPAARGTSISITTLAEDVATNGNCTLREALIAAATGVPQDACPADAGSDTIELAAPGSYVMNDGDVVLPAGRTLTVRGAPSLSAGSYVIDLDDSQRFLDVAAGSSLTLENLTLSDGSAASGAGGAVRVEGSDLTLLDVRVIGSRAAEGGGISFFTDTERRLDVESSTFQDNLADADQADGGGLRVVLQGAGSVRIVDTEFVGNDIDSATGSTSRSGGGLSVQSFGGGEVELRHLLALNNTIDAPSFSTGAGIALNLYQSGAFLLEDVDVQENQMVVDAGSNQTSGIDVLVTDGAATLRRLRVVHNPGGSGKLQFHLSADGTAQVVLSDVLIARGLAQGGAIFGNGSDCDVLAGSLTVTDNPDTGLILSAGSCPLRLENSIVTGNATSLGSDLDATDATISAENLIGEDAGFVDAAGGDYRLGALSAAIGAGVSTFLSVGPFDLDHGPRIAGAQIDLGAFERDAIFADDFEWGDLFPWSSNAGAP